MYLMWYSWFFRLKSEVSDKQFRDYTGVFMRLKQLIFFQAVLLLFACSTEPKTKRIAASTGGGNTETADSSSGDSTADPSKDDGSKSTEDGRSSGMGGGDVAVKPGSPIEVKSEEKALSHINADTQYSPENYCIATITEETAASDMFGRELKKIAAGSTFLIESFPSGSDLYLLLYLTAEGSTSFYLKESKIEANCTRSSSYLSLHVFKNLDLYSDIEATAKACTLSKGHESDLLEFEISTTRKDGNSAIKYKFKDSACPSGDLFEPVDSSKFWYLSIAAIRTKY
jgi:hypothetical protein